jgi:UDP-glucose 4-epimerase
VINGDGLQTRDFVYVNDIAAGIMLAVKAGDERGLSGTFNLATGRSISINELAKNMVKIFGLDLEPEYGPEREGDVKFAQVDISKARDALGYSPAGKLEEVLAELLKPQVQSLQLPA